MREIKIKGKPYVIKFTYKAAKCQDCVQKMFEVLTGASLMKNIDPDNPSLSGLITGTSAQVGEIPTLCDVLMFAGLKAENPVDTIEEAGDLLIEYMEENEEKSYSDIFDSFKECMTEDGFFRIAGIDKMVENMNSSMENAMKESQNVAPAKKTTAKKKTTPVK